MGKTIVFEFTIPPLSVNESLVVNNFRIEKSIAAKNWLEKMGWELKLQSGKLPSYCYYRADILTPAHMTTKDIDNCIKPLMDLFVKHKRTPDDKYMVDVRNRYSDKKLLTIALREEDLDYWALIKKPSKAIYKKLKQHRSLGY